MKILYCRSPGAWRSWLRKNHATAREQWVGFYKKRSGKPSMTWPESADEALCFGWIDGLRRSMDGERYAIRFTPRRPRSTWSEVNLKRVRALMRLGRMQPPGLRAYRARDPLRSGVSSATANRPVLGRTYLRELKANAAAWEFFRTMSPSYRRAASGWIMSARRAETRRRRLAVLIRDSARGRTIPPLTRSENKP